MLSPVHGIMPQSGRKYTYTRCSDFPSRLSFPDQSAIWHKKSRHYVTANHHLGMMLAATRETIG
jgi:hypothetical protein